MRVSVKVNIKIDVAQCLTALALLILVVVT